MGLIMAISTLTYVKNIQVQTSLGTITMPFFTTTDSVGEAVGTATLSYNDLTSTDWTLEMSIASAYRAGDETISGWISESGTVTSDLIEFTSNSSSYWSGYSASFNLGGTFMDAGGSATRTGICGAGLVLTAEGEYLWAYINLLAVSSSGSTSLASKLGLSVPTTDSFGYATFNVSELEISGGERLYFYTQYNYKTSGGLAAINTYFRNNPPNDSTTEDPYDGKGEGTFGGGTIGVPDLPTLSGISTGLFTLYAPTETQMQALADFLWTNIDFSTVVEATDTTSALNAIGNIFNEIGEALKRMVADPLKLVLGLSIIPSQGLSTGDASEVKVGFWSTGVSMTTLTNQYFTVDCGTLSFATVCGNTFLDYAPYAKFSIYLPYVGTKQVDANDFVGHTIGVVYHCDCVSGACTCYVTKDGSTMYQYSGNIALNLPLSSESWSATFASAVEIAGAIGTAIASGGGIASAGVAAEESVANIASNPTVLSPQVAHSGATSGAAGLMGVQIPYVIREAAQFPTTSGFNAVMGYPSHYLVTLSDVSGYTVVGDVHLTGMSATESEIAEIEGLLKGGVIF